jgi:probable phosphoglycerate mutase
MVTSDLARAIDTARVVNEPHQLDMDITPLLRERDWGDFTGRYIPDIQDETFPDNVEPVE